MNWWIFWFAMYIVGIYAIGLYYAQKIDSADDYVMADFNLGFFPIAGSIVTSALGAAAVIGSVGKGFTMGLSWAVATTSPYMIFSLILCYFLGSTIRKLKLYTLPDLFVRRYGKSAGLIPTIISIVYMSIAFGLQVFGMSLIIKSIFHMTPTWAMLVGFALCVGFTLLGGLPSVAWTDAVQAILIVGGIFVMMVLGINHVGGMGKIIANTPKQLLDPLGMNPKDLINFLVVYGPFFLVWQISWQRLAAAKTAKTAVNACAAGHVLIFIIGIFSIVIGIAARQTLPLDAKPDLVYTTFMTELFHPAIGGLFMITLFAALLTGATSFLLSGAINIVKDIYQPWINPQATDNQILYYSRFSVALMSLLGLGVAFMIKDIIEIYMYALSFSAVTMVFPVLAAMYWKRATKTGVLVSIAGSLITAIIWNLIGRPYGIHEILPGLMVSFLLLVGVSLLTEHSSEEEVIAYYFSLKDNIV